MSAIEKFHCSQIRKLGFLKSEIFKHPSFRYLPLVKHENLDFRRHPPFRYSPIVKYENLDLSIPGGIFQYMTNTGHATRFGFEFGTVPGFLSLDFWGQIWSSS